MSKSLITTLVVANDLTLEILSIIGIIMKDMCKEHIFFLLCKDNWGCHIK